MPVKKPPITSSIGIEIKSPMGVELVGDTNVVPIISGDNTDWENGVHLYFSDGSFAYEDFDSKEAALSFVRDVAVHGYLKFLDEKPGKYKYYMPISILSAEITIEEEEED
ncbi:MAG: hypothetical protein KAS32_17755 [Candidatus Peribacteraceae bacterium]|nr:hypothetical protein [Candidatus Peribacteraceae bacterium]